MGLERRITVHMAGILVQAGAVIQNEPASNRMFPGGLCVHSSHSVILGASLYHLVAKASTIALLFNNILPDQP